MKGNFHEDKNPWNLECFIFMFCSKIFKLKLLTLVFKDVFVRAYISVCISFSSLNTLNSSQKRLHVFTDGSLVFLNRSFMLKLVSLPRSLILHGQLKFHYSQSIFLSPETETISPFLNFCKLLSGPLFYFLHTMLHYGYTRSIAV